MAFTRKALAARRQVRQQAGGSYVAILREGEKAARSGLDQTANPYSDSEDHEIWAEGYRDGAAAA